MGRPAGGTDSRQVALRTGLPESRKRIVTPEENYLAAQGRLLAANGVTASSRFIKLPWRGLRTHVLQAGEGDPVVFVIGGGGFAALWAPLLARMPDHRLYAVDRPGFGLTDAVEHRTGTLRETAVGFLAGALDGLGIERATFVSNSMGSLWTFWLALDRPERVERMIHVGCPALLLDTGAPMPMPLLGVPLIGRLMMALVRPSPRQARMVFESMKEEAALRNDPALLAAVLATERLPAYGPAWRELLGAVLTPFGARRGIPLTSEQLRRVRHPVQLIWGQDDPFGPVETGRRAADLLPDAQFSAVAGGHMPWFDAPDEVAALVQVFLRQSRPAASAAR